MKIIIYDGLLWEDNINDTDNIVPLPKADEIAFLNKHMFAEGLAKAYPDGTVLHLDKDLKIVKEEKP